MTLMRNGRILDKIVNAVIKKIDARGCKEKTAKEVAEERLE